MTRFLGLLAATLGAYHVVFFVIPFEKGAAFWIGYAFGLAALIAAFALWYFAHVKKNEWDEPCCHPAAAKLTARYGAIQVLMSLATAALGKWIPWWTVLVVFVLLWVVAVAAGASSAAEREKLRQHKERREESTDMILRLQRKIGAAIAQCEDESTAKALSGLKEQLQFSDPVSSAATEAAEADLMAIAEELELCLVETDWAAAEQLRQRFLAILASRNDICKQTKE